MSNKTTKVIAIFSFDANLEERMETVFSSSPENYSGPKPKIREGHSDAFTICVFSVPTESASDWARHIQMHGVTAFVMPKEWILPVVKDKLKHRLRKDNGLV